MNRSHYAILVAQALSYCLIITFVFADSLYNFTGLLRDSGMQMTLRSAYIASCLIGIVGVISIWLTWFYISKSNKARDMLVICAWTHRVKTKDGWVRLETFFTDQLGYAVSHGLSTEKLEELRNDYDKNWKKTPPAAAKEETARKPMGIHPVDTEKKPSLKPTPQTFSKA